VSIINKIEDHLIRNLEQDIDETRYWSNLYQVGDFETESHGLVFQRLFEVLDSSASTPGDRRSVRTVDAFYKEDKFVGYVIQHCQGDVSCDQMLVEKNLSAHIIEHSDACLNLPDQRLQTIEVGHEFDSIRRAFTDLTPLNENSDVVVYHEWLVQRSATVGVSSKAQDAIRFTWHNPRGEIVMIQNAKLKLTSKLTRLFLAHRLNVRKPLAAGIWRLVVSRGEKNCLSYEFPVLDRASATQSSASSYRDLQKFYMVTKACPGEAQTEISSKSPGCSEWTSFSKEKFSARYDLE